MLPALLTSPRLHKPNHVFFMRPTHIRRVEKRSGPLTQKFGPKQKYAYHQRAGYVKRLRFPTGGQFVA